MTEPYRVLKQAVDEGDMLSIIIGVLHVQGRLAQMIESIGGTPDLLVGLLDADLARPAPAGAPAALNRVLQAMRDLISISTPKAH